MPKSFQTAPAQEKVGPALIAGMPLLAALVRLPLLPFTTTDMSYYLLRWVAFIQQQGGFPALAFPFSNYAPAYTYLLLLVPAVDFLPQPVTIKLISILFDFAAAALVERIVRLFAPHGPLPWLAGTAALFAPVVVLTGAYWGQCDSIYTTFLLGFLYFILRQKPLPAMLAFSLAFAFKLQAAFLGPLVLALLLRRVIPWRLMALPPAVYLLLALPAWAAGRPLRDLLLVYLDQGGYYTQLSMAAPNPYVFLADSLYRPGLVIGLILAAGLCLAAALLLWRSPHSLSRERLVLAAAAVLLLAPYVLPKMHERYFYPAGLFALILAFTLPRLKWTAAALQLSILLSYLPFLYHFPFTVVQAAALLNTAVLVALVRELIAPRRTDSQPVLAPG